MLLQTDTTHPFYCYMKLEVIRIKTEINFVHVEVTLAREQTLMGSQDEETTWKTAYTAAQNILFYSSRNLCRCRTSTVVESLSFCLFSVCF